MNKRNEKLVQIQQTENNEKLISDLKEFIANYHQKKIPNDSILAKSYHLLGRTFWYINELEDGIKYTKKAIEINTEKGQNLSKANLANSYYNIGKIYAQKNDYINSIENFEKSLAFSKKYAEKEKLIALNYASLSNIYFLSGDYQKCINFANTGVEYAIKMNHSENISYCLLEKSQGQIGLGLISDAEKTLQKSTQYLLETKNNILIGIQYSKFATCFNNAKNYPKAIQYFKESFKILNSKNENGNVLDNYGSALALNNLGYLYLEIKDYKKAIYYFQKAIPFLSDGFDQARVFDNLGEAYIALKQFGPAKKYLQLALLNAPINYNNPNFEMNPSAQVIKYIPAKEYLLSIINNKAKYWLSFAKGNNLSTLSLKYSLQTFQVADKMIEYMRQSHTATESKYYWRDKTRPIYENAIETCLLLKDYEKALYFFEKSRSVMLNDKLNEMGAKQKLSEADQRKEKEFISKILALNADIENEKDVKKKENLISKQNDLVENQSQFIKTLETKNPAYYQIKYDTNTVSLRQMQDYLKTNFNDKPATIVEYFMGESATYVLVVSANKAEIKKIKYDSKLADSFLSLSSRRLNTKAELDSFNHIGLALNNQLIKPLNIPKGHLIISQDGSFLPFEALINSTKKGDYLVNDYSISYTYSAQFLLKNKLEKSFSPNKNFIGFAPVNFSKLASLNGSKKSISNLADHYFFNTKLIEKEATKNNFLAQANSYKIVQLYTHALADSNDIEPTIYFADSTLKVSELSAENQFKTQLLVLSACKTGVGKLAKGEGILSLARGFSMLGIPATITSLWSVEDTDTYQITELFYNFLNKGFSKDEALQKAKIEFINQSNNPQPYAWAGMVLVGETEPIGNSQLYLWIIVAISTICILGFLLIKYKYRLK